MPSIKSLIIASLVGAQALLAADHSATLEKIEKVANQGPFKADWDSLGQYKIPEWYQDAKFGIFIHWGAYSVPGFGNEWYPREMYTQEKSRKGIFEHHKKTYGGVEKTGYKDFIPQFTAEKFDADAWAKLFKDAGAKYIIPVAEHHDGFPMYDSDYTEWSAAKMGPKRDLIGEMAKAFRKKDLIFGLSSHRAEHWWFYGNGRKIPGSDVNDERYRGLYGPARDREESENGTTPPDKAFLDDWLLRCSELVDKYEPKVIWFDWWMAQPAFHQHLKDFTAYYYNKASTWDKMGAINYKKFGGASYPDTAGVLDIERGGLADIRELFWQTDTSVSKTSWGYVSNHQYKTVNSLVDDLIDIVSKNGCMLLNVGPKPDGTIPEQEQQMLLEMGEWLKVNGEAIYKTRPWIKFGEGPVIVKDGTHSNKAEASRKDFGPKDIRFTTHGGDLYAIVLDWPTNSKKLTIKSLTTETLSGGIKNIKLLGGANHLKFEQNSDGLTIDLPARPKSVSHAYTFKISSK